MNKEINETLELIDNVFNKNFTCDLDVVQKTIINTITNLQEKNKESEEAVYYWQERCDIEQRKINEAIKWCECVINCKTTGGELPNGDFTDMGYCSQLAFPLLDILKGDE